MMETSQAPVPAQQELTPQQEQQQQPHLETNTPLPPTPKPPRRNNGADEEQWTLRYIYPTAGAKPASQQANQVPIVTQDANGPCSLVALSNILLLRNILTISPSDRPAVDFTYLSRSIAELFLTRPCPEDQDETSWQNTLTQALDILPTTRHGLDVNVDFRDAAAFHPPQSPQLALFRLFGIRLVHGWLPDPADRPTFEALVPSSSASAAPAGAAVETSSSSQLPQSASAEEWRTGSDYDAVIQRLVSAQDIAGNFADLDLKVDGQRADPEQVPQTATEKKGKGKAVEASSDAEQSAAPAGDVSVNAEDSLVQKMAESSLTEPQSTERPIPQLQSNNPFLPAITAESKGKGAETSDGADTPMKVDPETNGPESWTDDQRRSVGDAIQIRTFLESNPTQLSIYGLFALASTLQPGELCALFRNMHLSCLYRRREDEGLELVDNPDVALSGQQSELPPLHQQQQVTNATPHLFTLVTDEFLARAHPEIVWESLEDVHGSAGAFYDAFFRRVQVNPKKTRWAMDQETRGPSRGQGQGRGQEGQNIEVPDGFWDPVVPNAQSEAASGGGGGDRRSPGYQTEGNQHHYQHDGMDPSIGDADYALAYQLQQEERQAAREADRARRHERGTSTASAAGYGREDASQQQQQQQDEALAGVHEDLGGSGDGSRRNKMMKKRQSGSGKSDKCVVM
ncbi:hypothetical protein CF326_g3941 [Tilletia indica]|nr:hypothetical protein CF326_g3941 [Tilletia indica]